jgi:hypothetical protein
MSKHIEGMIEQLNEMIDLLSGAEPLSARQALHAHLANARTSLMSARDSARTAKVDFEPEQPVDLEELAHGGYYEVTVMVRGSASVGPPELGLAGGMAAFKVFGPFPEELSAMGLCRHVAGIAAGDIAEQFPDLKMTDNGRPLVVDPSPVEKERAALVREIVRRACVFTRRRMIEVVSGESLPRFLIPDVLDMITPAERITLRVGLDPWKDEPRS